MKLSIVAAIALLAVSFTDAATIKANPLPKPVDINWGNTGPIKVNKYFTFAIAGAHDNILQDAAARTLNNIRKEMWIPQAWEAPMPQWPAFPKLKKRLVEEPEVEERDYKRAEAPEIYSVRLFARDISTVADLQHGVDESYEITVTDQGQAEIKANTVWGALHGLATFEQLVISEDGNNLIIEQPVSIKDAPKYTHRGVMYDTSRNFLPVTAIKKQIETLAFSKLNVFHWHITDSQSWPLEIKGDQYKNFIKGAYSPREVYTHADVQDVVAYGRAHGVRVIPEIDMPAHSNKGWADVDPKTIACGNSWWSNDDWPNHSAVQPNPGHLDIMYPRTYVILQDIANQLSPLFKDNVFHVGFDELIPNCYNYSAPTMEWFQQNPGKDYSDLAQYWVDKLIPIFTTNQPQRRLMMWEDSVLSHAMPAKNIPTNVIMQSWNNGVDNIKALAQKGYDIVVTSADFFYLDCGHGGYVTNDARYNEQSKPEIHPVLAKALEEHGNGYGLTTLNYGGSGAS
ncbi:hypothetical protein BGZ73_000325, partial [Actinomortierella ambigua]